MTAITRRALAALAVSTALATPAFAQSHKYTIGLSNGWVGSEWRTQMVEEAQAAAAAWKARGVDVDVDVIVQSKTEDVQQQIADVKNFINQGVSAIVVNPNSPTAFSPTFAQAKKAGILVFAADGEVASKDATFVGIDQKEWASRSAEWLAKQLNGKGNIVTINGIAGHPANQARVAGYKETFAKYPGIKVLNEANGDWDEAKAQQVTKTLLATYPDLQGVWTQDGQASGVWRAMVDAKRTSIPTTGELRASFVHDWQANKWNSAVSVNPPGVMAAALDVAVLELEGNKLKPGALRGPNGNALYLPVPLIDNANLDETAKQLAGKPDYAFVTVSPSIDELKARFFQ